MLSRTTLLTSALSQLSVGSRPLAAVASTTARSAGQGTLRTFHAVSKASQPFTMARYAAAADTNQCTLQTQTISAPTAVCSLHTDLATALLQPQMQGRRSFASKSKKKANKSKTGSKATPDGGSTAKDEQPFLQHQQWVKFQQSISVEGFQTGQITTAKVVGAKKRGGKQSRKRLLKEQAATKMASADVGTTKFPAIRFSEEETERLLAEAFATLPERAGKRGTRNLKRQGRRWFLVRKIHARQKRFLVAAHHRKMAKRHTKRQAVIEMKHVISPKQRLADAEYQRSILHHWAANVIQSEAPDEETVEVSN